MKTQNNIAIIGGDTRQKFLYYELRNQGYNIYPFYIEDVNDTHSISERLPLCNLILFPIPFSKDKINLYSKISTQINIDYLLTLINPCSVICGGCFNNDFISKCNNLNIVTKDLMDIPSFELYNSIATAEGTVAEAICTSPINIHKSHSLVLGYGKCGMALAARLKALNAITYVAARNPVQLSMAYEQGHTPIPLNELTRHINKFDFIFNTIPSLILNRSILSNANTEATIIDIASNPGGTDFEACKHFGITARLCLSLPGKYSPKASAQIISRCIVSMLN